MQLVFTTSPLWTALVASAVLNEAPLPLLWPVFGATVAGSGGPSPRPPPPLLVSFRPTGSDAGVA